MKDSKKKENTFCIDVDVTGLDHEKRLQVVSQYSKKSGFIDFSTRWENQFTDKEKMFYAFKYRKGRRRTSNQLNHE